MPDQPAEPRPPWVITPEMLAKPPYLPYRYILESLDRRPKGVLARLVTLKAILRSGYRLLVGDPEESKKRIQESVARVRSLWYERLLLLQKLDLDFCASHQFTMAANCPPVGGFFRDELDRPAKRCMRRSLCPWCWARRVAVPTLHNLNNVLDAVGMTWIEPPANNGKVLQRYMLEAFPYRLARFVRIRVVSGDVRTVLDMAAARLEGEWLNLKAAGCRGALLISTVGPRYSSKLDSVTAADLGGGPEYLVRYGWLA